jgi:hypothetical protein
LNLSMQMIELDIAGANSRASLSFINSVWVVLEAGHLLSLVEDAFKEAFFLRGIQVEGTDEVSYRLTNKLLISISHNV